MIKIIDGQRRRETRDGNETRRIDFDGDGPNVSGPLANPFFPLVEYNEIILRPDGELRRRRTFVGETISYVRRGAVRGAASVDASDVILAGGFARIAAERGSKYVLKNDSATQRAEILEIGLWLPAEGLEPGCVHQWFSRAHRRSALSVVASPDCRGGSLQLAQDVVVYSAILMSGQRVAHEIDLKRRVWLQVVEGELAVGDVIVGAGSGAGVAGVCAISVTARESTEFLLVDIGSAGARF